MKKNNVWWGIDSNKYGLLSTLYEITEKRNMSITSMNWTSTHIHLDEWSTHKRKVIKINFAPKVLLFFSVYIKRD